MSYMLKNPAAKSTVFAMVGSTSSQTFSTAAGTYQITLDALSQSSNGALSLSGGACVLTAGRYLALLKMDLRVSSGNDSTALTYSVEIRLNGTKISDLDVISQSNNAPVDATTSLGGSYFTAQNGDLLTVYVVKTASTLARIYYPSYGGIALIGVAS